MGKILPSHFTVNDFCSFDELLSYRHAHFVSKACWNFCFNILWYTYFGQNFTLMLANLATPLGYWMLLWFSNSLVLSIYWHLDNMNTFHSEKKKKNPQSILIFKQTKKENICWFQWEVILRLLFICSLVFVDLVNKACSHVEFANVSHKK